MGGAAWGAARNGQAMTIKHQHPMILRLLGLAMFTFGAGVLGFPAVGEVAETAIWKVAAITTSMGSLFMAVGAYALLGQFEVEIDLPHHRVSERRQLGPLRWTRAHDIDDFDRVTITEREIKDSSHAMTFYQLHLRGRGRRSDRPDRAHASTILLDSDKRYDRIRALAARVSKTLGLDLYDQGHTPPLIRYTDMTTRPLRQRLQEGDARDADISRDNTERISQIATGIVPLPRRLSRWREALLATAVTVPFIAVVTMLEVKILAMSPGARPLIVATAFGIAFIIAPLLAACWSLLRTLSTREYLRADTRSLSLEQRWLLGHRVEQIDIDDLMEVERSDEDLVAYGLHNVFSFGHGLSREQLGALHAELCRRIMGA